MDLIIKKNNNVYIAPAIILISIYSFSGYLFNSTINYFLLFSTIGYLVFTLLLNKGKQVSQTQLMIISLLIIFITLQLVQAPYTIFSENSINTGVSRGCILLIGVLLCIQDDWYRDGKKYIFMFSLVHVAFTLMAFLIPSFFLGTFIPILPSEIANEIISFLNKGVYSGITDQIGRNAFYISVCVAMVYAYILNRTEVQGKRKILMYTLLLMSILALMITGKRGHLLANVFAIIVIQIIYAKIRGKSILFKLLTIVTTIIIVIYVIVILFPEAAAPFMRFIERQGGDQTSGRIDLFILAIELFKEKPLMGWGIGVFNNLYGIGAHNVYLQILSEHGFIGFVLFVIILFINIKKVLSQLMLSKNNSSNYDKSDLLFSLYIQIFFIIYGLTGNPLNDGFILVIYLMAASIPYNRQNINYVRSMKYDQ